MSFIIDALKRVQKARQERDKEESAKTILFPSGDSGKSRPFFFKRILIPAILLFILAGTLFISRIPYKEKHGREKNKISMPSEPRTNKIHAEIPPRPEPQGPTLIILPPVEGKKKRDMGTRKSPPRGKDLKGKHETRTREKLPAAISGPAMRHKPHSGPTRSLPAGASQAGSQAGLADRQSGRTKLKPEPPPPKPSPPPIESAASHFNLGVSYQEEGKLRKAIEEYEKVISIEPFNVEAYNNLGMAYKDLGELDKAIDYYRQAIALDPRYERAHCNLAIAFYLKGDLDAAVSEARLAIALNPEDIESYNNLGLFYKESNRVHEAMEAFLKALALDPGYAPAHYNLALLLEKEGRTKEAISHYQRFMGLSRSRNNRDLVEKVARHIESLQASLHGN